jgi:energy-coupling factor transporter ATP-binding protein EcfA2
MPWSEFAENRDRNEQGTGTGANLMALASQSPPRGGTSTGRFLPRAKCRERHYDSDMLTRLYANNFRCLVAFEAKFESFGVLCGPNGSGKSSVLDALLLVRNLANGDGILGGGREQDLGRLEFSEWQPSTVQEFELGFAIAGRAIDYILYLEQKPEFDRPRIVRERATADGRILFDRDQSSLRIPLQDGSLSAFPLDWRQSALSTIRPLESIKELQILQSAISKLLILRPNPRGMEAESRTELKLPDLLLTRLTSWYRSLSQDMEWTHRLAESLTMVWPDFKSFRLVDVGLNAKALKLRFYDGASGNACELFFDQLSDGEKALIGLYMVRAALASGAIQTVLIDEPDNYVGLPELQPWVLSLRELLDDDHQAILISHHPEILSSAGAENGRYLWRDHHTSPTRIGPLTIPDGLTPGEAIARGWVRG